MWARKHYAKVAHQYTVGLVGVPSHIAWCGHGLLEHLPAGSIDVMWVVVGVSPPNTPTHDQVWPLTFVTPPTLAGQEPSFSRLMMSRTRWNGGHILPEEGMSMCDRSLNVWRWCCSTHTRSRLCHCDGGVVVDVMVWLLVGCVVIVTSSGQSKFLGEWASLNCYGCPSLLAWFSVHWVY